MDNLNYAKKWIKRPNFQGMQSDKEVLESLISEIEIFRKIFDNPTAWAKTNSRGDIFDLRLSHNPYENNVIPLYLGVYSNAQQQ